MAHEPSPHDRQRRAFELLRDQARSAHAGGDGLRVGHLCETALHEADRLANQGRLLLHLSELQWAFIFQWYWLLQNHVVEMSLAILPKIPQHDDLDRSALVALRCYAYLIQQALSTADEIFRQLELVPAEAFGTEPLPENAELLTHLIELAWFHLVGDGRWVKVVQRWAETGSPWIRPVLQPVQRRLEVQARLTVPSKLHPPYNPNEATKLREVSDLGELWLLHLSGRSEELLVRIKDLSPRLRPDAYHWRLIADFWHINSMSALDEGDGQGVWLARRRQMTTDYPVLVFHDRRQLRIDELFRELYRRRQSSAASERWEALQLAMLHELAALRIWDFGMWREAARDQSELLLEAAQWMETNPAFTAQGLTSGIRGISLRPPAEDYLSRSAIRHVEFASEQVLHDFSTDLLSTYPRQKHNEAALLVEVGDLFPPNLWSELASWTVDYAQDSRAKYTSGWKLNPLEHWLPILPLVPENSDVWLKLHGEAIVLARIPHCWQRGDEREIIRLWLASSPHDAARQLAEAMLSVATSNPIDSLARAELLTEAEKYRPELGDWASRQLKGKAVSAEERLVLARHLDDNNAAERLEAQARESTIVLIRQTLINAAPPPENSSFDHGPFIRAMHLIEQWPQEDKQLLREIIATIESPNILMNRIPQLLYIAQQMIASGPRDFAEVIQPHFSRWAENPPTGRRLSHEVDSPFAMVRMGGIDPGSIGTALGWISFQLLRKLGSSARTEATIWIRSALLSGEIAPMAIAFYVSVVLATQGSEQMDIPVTPAAEAVLLTLRVRMNDSQLAGLTLANAFHYLAGIVGKQTFDLIDWSSNGGRVALRWLIQILEEHSSILAAAADPQLRSSVSEVLWSLSRWYSLPESLSAILEKLKTDNRARVRFWANGGWRARHAEIPA